MDLPTMRSRLETDLKDTGNARWTDAELDRATGRAVGEYSLAAPLLGKVDLAVGSSRWFDLSAQAGYLWCEAVEYPIDDEDGPLYRLFREDRAGKKVYVLGSGLVEGENVRFWLAKAHTLDVTTSTIPMEHEELILLGAAGFAALSMAEYVIDRVTVSGWAPRQYREWGEGRLAEFRRRLEDIRLTRASGLGSFVSWGSASV